jgi:thiol-disulfide isomerase/thioredoxin
MRAILIFLLGVWFVGPGARADTPGEVPVGGLLREARMFSVSGPPRMLSTFRGKPLIINVWASWCGPCRQEMSSLQRLSQIDTGKQFRVIGISTDDDAIAATEYVVKSKLSFENFVDHNLLLENMLGANTIPLTLLVDANGRVLAKIRGSRDWTSPASIALVEKTFRIRFTR